MKQVGRSRGNVVSFIEEEGDRVRVICSNFPEEVQKLRIDNYMKNIEGKDNVGMKDNFGTQSSMISSSLEMSNSESKFANFSS